MTAESHNLQTGKWSFNNHINISPNLELVSVHKSFDTIESSSIIKRFSFGELNGNSSYIYCCFSFRPKESTSRFFWVFNMIKQWFWYGVAYHFYQMRFTSTSSALKKYINWFCLMHQPHWRLSFALDLRNLYLLRFHYLIMNVPINWEVQKFCLFIFLPNHFYWDILSLLFHHFQFACVSLEC